mmetsp:Transcript_26172/g.40119  ORF Transcript_26172/g.40119 Transcript_26172/m.40119 type:complete len:122 (+) Transcript_26172:530-895(+)
MAKAQGMNVDNLLGLTKENQALLDKMKASMKAQASQRLLQIVFQSDRDESSSIDSEREINRLIIRLKGVDGIQLDEERFKDELKASGGSLESVLKLVKSLDDDTIPENEKILTVSASQQSQ